MRFVAEIVASTTCHEVARGVSCGHAIWRIGGIWHVHYFRKQDFGPDFLLRRHDYHVEASGGFAAAQ